MEKNAAVTSTHEYRSRNRNYRTTVFSTGGNTHRQAVSVGVARCGWRWTPDGGWAAGRTRVADLISRGNWRLVAQHQLHCYRMRLERATAAGPDSSQYLPSYCTLSRPDHLPVSANQGWNGTICYIPAFPWSARNHAVSSFLRNGIPVGLFFSTGMDQRQYHNVWFCRISLCDYLKIFAMAL